MPGPVLVDPPRGHDPPPATVHRNGVHGVEMTWNRRPLLAVDVERTGSNPLVRGMQARPRIRVAIRGDQLDNVCRERSRILVWTPALCRGCQRGGCDERGAATEDEAEP